MAITSNRVVSKNITDMVSVAHISATDKTKDIPANTAVPFAPKALSSKLSSTIGKKNIFSKLPPLNPGKLLAASGVFPKNGDPSCALDVTAVAKSQDDRLLAATQPDSACTPSQTTSYAIMSVLDHMTAGLSEAKVSAIESMYKTELGKHSKNILGLAGTPSTPAILKGVASVNSALSGLGATAMDSSGLMSLLGCKNNAGLNSANSSLIQNIVVSGLLMQSMCVGVGLLTTAIGALASAGVVATGDILSGVVIGFAASEGISADTKMGMLAKASGVLVPATTTDTAKSSGMLDTLMSSLSNSQPDTKSASGAFSNLTSGLSLIAPDWNKDSTGQPNLSKTKGNGYIATLSALVLKTTSVPASSITADPTVPVVPNNNINALLALAANTVKTKLISGKQIRLGKYSYTV